MTPSLNSQSFKSAPLPLPVEETVREVVAAMPIVIFANAIRDAVFRRKAKAAGSQARTIR